MLLRGPWPVHGYLKNLLARGIVAGENPFLRGIFLFMFPLIVDRKLTGFEAVRASIRAAWGNFGGVIGLVVLTNLLSLAGTLACCVGSIFVLPIGLAAQAVAYRQVFPADEPVAVLPVES